MFKVATTLQFRNAVRTVAAEMGVSIQDSYTNSKTFSNSKVRTVGFYMPLASAALARKIENSLNAYGLRAETRFTNTDHASYIRGNCVIA